MVFFTCNHCGESLKKAAVEKHYQWKSCRNAPIFLTCVDCLKDFRELEYVAHTKCITEAERYSAKGFVSKPDKNKGAQKQEIWTECIEELALRSDLDNTVKNILKRIAAQSNVPRKKAKFVNFLKSSMHFDIHRAEKVWTIIEEGLEEFKKRSAPPPREKPKEETNTESNGKEAEAEKAVIETNGNANTDTNNVSNDSELTEIFTHILAQTDLDKATKKTLKKLQKRSDLPLNCQNPKKKKIIKFLQSSIELDADTSERIWTLLSASINAVITTNGKNHTSNGNDTSHTNGITANGSNKKRKNSESVQTAAGAASKTSKKENGCTPVENCVDNSVNENTDTSAFDWQKNILRIFNKISENNEIDLGSLKTKVIKKFVKHLGDGSDTTQHEKKLNKQLKKIDSLLIENGLVKLKV